MKKRGVRISFGTDSGVYPHGDYEGSIFFDGEERRFRDVNDSEALGIIIIHQELALIPLLSIAENAALPSLDRFAGRFGELGQSP